MTQAETNRYYSIRNSLLESEYAHLNPPQREAVLHVNGPMLVLAGAGSGKTTVLTHRVAHILRFGDAYGSDAVPPEVDNQALQQLEALWEDKKDDPEIPIPEHMVPYLAGERVSPYSIIAITFTNKAAREMKERIVSLIGPEAESMWLATFHSACVRILRREIEALGYDRRFTIYDSHDQLVVVKECVHSLNLNDKQYPPRGISERISNYKNTMMKPADVEAEGGYREGIIAQVYALYQKKLKDNNALDFDDLLNLTVELFTAHPEILERYARRFRYVLVDEYQDTNMAQYELVRLLSSYHQNIFVVGDDDQSIYGWRGADIRNILEFESDFPSARVIKLEQNYRSTQSILDAANAVIALNRDRKAKALWTDAGGGELLDYRQVENEREEAEITCARIETLVKKGLNPGDMAVLYRITAQSRAIEETLIKYAIPYRIYGGTRFYDRKEIKDILAYLRLLINPADDVSLRRVINEPKRGIGKTSEERLADLAAQEGASMMDIIGRADEYADTLKTAAGKMKAFGELIEQCRLRLTDGDIADAIELVIDLSGYRSTLTKENTIESMARLENLDELVSAAKEFSELNPDEGLDGYLEHVALVADIDNMDEDVSTVSLMTFHSAKGLEFPVVFMVGMEETLFPHMRAMDTESEMEEERRLCYVGITRAKQRLYLTSTRSRMIHGSVRYGMPSRFLKEIPEKLLKDPDALKERPKTKQWGRPQGGKQHESYSFGGEYIQRTQAPGPVASGCRYSVGEQVMHKTFGKGEIVDIQGAGDSAHLSIKFEQGGVKKLLASYAPIKKIKG